MIQPTLQIANEDGKVLRVEGPAVGFVIKPGIADDWARNVSGLFTRRPGSFPVTVRLYPSQREIPVYGPGRHIVGEFEGLELRGAREGDVFVVELLERESDRAELSPFVIARNVPVQLANEVQTDDPEDDDGWEILPGQIGWAFYFSNDLTKTVQIWQKTAGAVWYPYGTNGIINPAADTAFYSPVAGGVGRIALVASAGGPMVAVDRVMGFA